MEWDNGLNEANPLQEFSEIVALPGYCVALACLTDANTPPEDDPSPFSYRWIVAPAGATFWTIVLGVGFFLLREWRDMVLSWEESRKSQT
jgi:hypothetical protein